MALNSKNAGKIENVVPADDPYSSSSLVPMLVIGLVLMVVGVIVAFVVSVG